MAETRRRCARRRERLLALGAQGGADQGRPWRRRRKRRPPDRAARPSRGSPPSASQTQNTHGTGCTLSSAIAAGLAKGLDARRGRARRQGLRHRRDRGSGPARRSGRATARCIISRPGGEKPANMQQRRKRDHATNAWSAPEPSALLGAIAAPTVARAQTRRWRMVTSWPKRLPGPGMSAERVAERIAAMSGGRLQITVHAAGEVVPAFEVLDAVGGGVAEIGHTAVVLLAGQAAGGGILHHGAVRADAFRARRLDRCRRRPGAMGRALRAVRRQAVHGRQYRRVHGRLVPARDQRRSTTCRA